MERAIEDEVDLVALTGDVVDRENRFFEAYGPLERGVRRLAEAGIPVVAVAGNHDFDVLPRLSRSLGSELFHLLGQGGVWERWTLAGRDGRRLHVDGWSFPGVSHPGNPLDGYEFTAPPDGPLLGLLHCDLDERESRYAPVDAAELRDRPPAFWMLGHKHRPELLQKGDQVPLLYPGSPQAMDPGETGAHGVWLLDIGAGGSVRSRFVPLSRVRYEVLEVDVGGVKGPDELEGVVAAAARTKLETVGDDAGPLRYILLRVRLVGRTGLHRHLHPGVLNVEALELRRGEIVARIERVEVATRPEADLEELAGMPDPPGALARMLLALRSDGSDAERAELVREARSAIRSVAGASAYMPLDPPPDGAALAILERQGWLLLDELLAQKEAKA